MTGAVSWWGLDFDTAEMDAEIRVVLGKIAPTGGALEELAVSARVTDAHAAAFADATHLRVRRAEAQGADLEDDTPRERAADEMVVCLYELARAQAALFAAHEALRRAQRLLESP